jgi:hypothetical protein
MTKNVTSVLYYSKDVLLNGTKERVELILKDSLHSRNRLLAASQFIFAALA